MDREGTRANKHNRAGEFFWPIGGTLLGLLAMPVAIAQYPSFFNANEWLLPVSTGLVVLCFAIPLLLHHNVAWLYRKITAIPRYGYPLFAVLIITIAGLFYCGAVKLFRFHIEHLRIALAKQVEPVLEWANPNPVIVGTRLSDVQLNAKASTEGRFDYSPKIQFLLSDAIQYTLSVTFFPLDRNKYKVVSKTVYIVVNPSPSRFVKPQPILQPLPPPPHRCPDIGENPYLQCKNSEMVEIANKLARNLEDLIVSIPVRWPLSREDFLIHQFDLDFEGGSDKPQYARHLILVRKDLLRRLDEDGGYSQKEMEAWNALLIDQNHLDSPLINFRDYNRKTAVQAYIPFLLDIAKEVGSMQQ